MRLFDSIILTENLSDDLPAGTQGTIVETYPQTDDVFIVELFDRDGNTLDVCDVHRHQITVTLPDFSDGEWVALLHDMTAHKLKRGQVGEIQARIGVGLYRVAFGQQTINLHATQMLLLHWQPTAESA